MAPCLFRVWASTDNAGPGQ